MNLYLFTVYRRIRSLNPTAKLDVYSVDIVFIYRLIDHIRAVVFYITIWLKVITSTISEFYHTYVYQFYHTYVYQLASPRHV